MEKEAFCMNRKKRFEKPKRSRCPNKRAAASFFGRAKNGATYNLLLERHYFRLELADTPLALVVMGIGRKIRHDPEGVGT